VIKRAREVRSSQRTPRKISAHPNRTKRLGSVTCDNAPTIHLFPFRPAKTEAPNAAQDSHPRSVNIQAWRSELPYRPQYLYRWKARKGLHQRSDRGFNHRLASNRTMAYDVV
jgi:hypothetical protein